MNKGRIHKNYLLAELKRAFYGWDGLSNIRNNIIGIGFILLVAKGIYLFVVDYICVSGGAENLLVIVFTLLVWTCGGIAINGSSMNINSEKTAGTLEQLYISPVNFYFILLARSIITLLSTTLGILAYFQLFIWINQIKISFNYLSFLMLFLLATLSLVGIGYLIAGLDLIFKGFSTSSGIIIFLLIGGMAINVYPFNIFTLLPYFCQIYTLKMVVFEAKVFELSWYLILISNSLIYVLIGIFMFIVLERKAKKLDKMFRK